MLGPIFALFILIVGVVTVVTGASLAMKPTERKLAFLRPLTTCLVFASVSGTCAGVMKSLKFVADMLPVAHSGQSVDLVNDTVFMAGLAESAVPAVAGFAFLAVAWLLAAIGLRRQI